MSSHKSDKDNMEGSWQAQIEYQTQEVKEKERSTVCFGTEDVNRLNECAQSSLVESWAERWKEETESEGRHQDVLQSNC